MKLLASSIMASVSLALKLTELYLDLTGLGAAVLTVFLTGFLLGGALRELRSVLLSISLSTVLSLLLGAAVPVYLLVELGLTLPPLDLYLSILSLMATRLLPLTLLLIFPLYLASATLAAVLYERTLT